VRGKSDVPLNGPERPGLALGEVGVRVTAKLIDGPAFRSVGTEEDRARFEVPEVSPLVCRGGRRMPVVQDRGDLCIRREGARGGSQEKNEDDHRKPPAPSSVDRDADG